MKITKKIMSVVFAAIMVISTFAVSVSAKTLTMELYGNDVTVDSADIKTIKSKTKYSGDTSKTLYNWYKFSTSKEGKVEIDYTTKGKNTNVFLLNSDGEPVERYNHSVEKGWLQDEGKKDRVYARSDGKKFTASFSFSLKKGTYYIAVLPGNSSTSYGGEYSFTVTFPQEATTSNANTSLTGDIKYLSLTMEEGDSITLAATGSSSSTKAKYTSSDKSVVTVSDKGKIKAKDPGNAEITIKCGKDTLVVKVKVTD